MEHGTLNIKKGFTLIEMLVMVAIMVTVGSLAAIIFFTTLKGASKSDVIREVKQNGEYALSVMERMIRNAKSIEAVGNCLVKGGCSSGIGTCLKIKNPDNQTTTFMMEPVGSLLKIAANSGNYLTNDKVKLVSPPGLIFICTANSGKPDVVTIRFTLSQAASSARPEETASIPFETTVSLRTY